MSTLQPYHRFDPAKDYDAIEFLPDRWHQSAEMNDLQRMFAHRVGGLGDALFAEGSIIRDARCFVDAATGTATLEAGAIYIKGAVRGVLPATLQVPTEGSAYVGVYVQQATVTELDDPGLRNPAAGTLGYQQPGAWRTRVRLVWGVKGDGKAGEFYGLWEVVDGLVKPRDVSGQLSPITQALAVYDRDSSGGTYIVSGMQATMLADHADGSQMYSIAAGKARIGGYPVDLLAARTVKVSTTPDLATVDSEPHLSSTEGQQHVVFDRWPVVGTPEVRIQSRKTVQVVHGGYSGAADPLPDAAVILIDQVKQGGTTYAATTDYVFTAGQIDWSPGGAEPAPGSTYEVTYQHITLATPQNLSPRGFDVTGALAGTLIQTTYTFAQRRIDRLVLTADGDIEAVRGVPDTWSPQPPTLPDNVLALMTIAQTWDTNRSIANDGVRLVPMPVLEDYDRRLDDLRAEMAELRLAVAMAGRYSGLMHGQFADPMADDSMRDAGLPQTALIQEGWLQLALSTAAHQVDAASGPRTIDHTTGVLLAQPLITGAMRINPSDMPSTRPAMLGLAPSVDRWVENIKIDGPVTIGRILLHGGTTGVSNDDVRAAVSRLYTAGSGTMRQIEVTITVSGFNAGEQIAAIKFGGHAVTAQTTAPGSTTANAQGVASARFTVPANIPNGTVSVHVTGSAGTTAQAAYTGEVRRLYSGMYFAHVNSGARIASNFKDIEL